MDIATQVGGCNFFDGQRGEILPPTLRDFLLPRLANPGGGVGGVALSGVWHIAERQLTLGILTG
jgi:hypothetical protein